MTNNKTEGVEEEFEPFGPEWVKEVGKLPKSMLIEMLKSANQERIKLRDQPPAGVEQRAKEFVEDFCKPVYYHSEACHKAAFAGFIAGSESQGQQAGWVSVKDRLPDYLETVFITNGKGWTTIGCRTDLYEGDNGEYHWCWAAANGSPIYEENGELVAECEADDYDVKSWHKLPKPLPPPPASPE